MPYFYDVARSEEGGIIPAPNVTVYEAGTTTKASIFTDAGLSSAEDNPFEGGSDGLYGFFVAEGLYKIRVEKSGFEAFEVDNVPIGVAVVNEAGGDVDFRIEGDTEANLLFADASTDRVGIGTAAPATALDISGVLSLDGSRSLYNAAATDGFTGSLFVGDGGQSLNNTAGSEGHYNTGVGLRALLSNTTGNNNTALGYQSLLSNTGGGRNTASGYQSLFNNTTGSSNTAFGYLALFGNTTGNSNTALGYQSLLSNTTGSSNTAFGYLSGRHIADGTTANQTTSLSVFLGTQTKASADGVSNEVVIGYNAIGQGSNTVTLGNANVTDVYAAEDAGATVHAGSLDLGLATEDLQIIDAGSTGATQQDWVEVQIGGVTGYIHVFPTK